MSLPLGGNAKLPKVIAELNAVGERLSAVESKATAAANKNNEQDTKISGITSELGELVDIRARITALEEKVASLVPCPDEPDEPEDPPPEDPPDPPDPPPDPPEEPDLFLLAEPDGGLDFAAFASLVPAAKTVLLFKSGVGTLTTPVILSIVDPDGIIANAVISIVDADNWHLTVSLVGKPVDTYAASITVESTNQTNAALVIPIDFVVTAAPEPEPPDEPDLFLLADPDDGLDFSVTEPSTPAQKIVLLYKSGTGTLQAPQVISSSDASGIINSAIVTQVSSDSWHLTVGMKNKAAGNYTASLTVRSANQTNANVVIPIMYTVAAAPDEEPPIGGESTYRGAALPTGMTATLLQSQGDRTTLATPFGGTVWDTSDLIIGSSRYNAATTLTVSGTGSAGRTELLAHLATVAANDADYKIILPVATLNGGNYTLPAKVNPNRHCWIVNTAVHAGTFATARGTKIPASTTGMSILQGADATLHLGIIEFEEDGDARGYSFHGCVIQNDQTSVDADLQAGVIMCYRNDPQTVLSAYPGRLYIDRCWLRGSPTTNVRRGILMSGPYLAIEDSRVTEIHMVGDESQGIGGWEAAQFHKHINCTFEAGTQAILYGGADPDNPNTNILDPADIYTERCYAFKPLTWLTTHGSYGGIHWTVKTGFEAKNVRRWLLDRCWTQNTWVDAQIGYGMLFQNLSDGNTNHLENRVRDVIVRNHRFDYTAQGLIFVSRVAFGGGALPSNRGTKIVFDNILFTRCGGNRADPRSIILNGNPEQNLGFVFNLNGDTNGITIDRISADTVNGGRLFNLSGNGALGSITNIVARLGQYGVFLDSIGLGGAMFSQYFNAGLTMAGNVGYDLSDTSPAGFSGWDADETSASMAFQDYANYDYRLTTQHLTKGVAGSRPGCDIDTLTTVLSGVNT